MGRLFTGLLAAVMLLAGVAACEAAPQVITASGVYTMGENDSPKIAKDAARQEAMRVATERRESMWRAIPRRRTCSSARTM